MTLRYLVPLLAWLVAIFIVSSFPNPPGSGGPDTRAQIAHVVEYAVLGFLAMRFAWAWFPSRNTLLLLAGSWGFAVAYGISDEIHQSFVPRRDASVDDVVLDAIGAALGLALWGCWQWFQRQRAMETA